MFVSIVLAASLLTTASPQPEPKYIIRVVACADHSNSQGGRVISSSPTAKFYPKRKINWERGPEPIFLSCTPRIV